MFVGHFAIALAAKKPAPRLSLGYTIFLAQLLDLIWPLLVFAGLEKVSVEPQATKFNSLNFESYPYSHGLVAVLFLSLLCGVLTYFYYRRFKEAFVAFGIVLSHWVLDFIAHRPDLPLVNDQGVKVGLSLWNSVAGTVIVELTMLAVGVYLFLRVQPAKQKNSKFWSFIGFLVFMTALMVIGPQPEAGTSANALAGPAFAVWLLVAWGFWIDRPDRQKM